MSDWHETKETQEQDTAQETTSEELSPAGISAIQGVTEGQDTQDQVQADDVDDLITIHPRKNVEILPSPEVEPITFRNPEERAEETAHLGEGKEGKIQPPPGWQPGGPERGG